MDMTIEQFCDKHDACDDGREWAIANCESMRDAWDKLKPEWLIWVATRDGVLTDRELRLVACWSVRQVWHLLTDERSRNAVEVAERYAVGDATDDELAAAWDAASAAARDAARVAARDAAWDAARAAARAAARVAARAAAWDAARVAAGAAARVAARAAARAAARVAARAAQAEWLRENTSPNFSPSS